MSRGKLKIFACRSGEDFANLVVGELNNLYKAEGKDAISLAEAEIRDFADKEIYVRLAESVRGSDVYVVQSMRKGANEANLHTNMWEMMLLGSAAKKYSSNHVTAVIPYMPYARQDRAIGEKREAVGAKEIMKHLEISGFERLIVMDIHSDQQTEFFDGYFDNLQSYYLYVNYIKNNFKDRSNVVIVSPDAGGLKRVEKFSEKVNTRFTALGKSREKANEVKNSFVLGGRKEVYGKVPITYDDIVDTAGTLESSIKVLSKKGSRKTCVLVPMEY